MSEKKIKYSPDHTFFTSDTHFGHANIIRFCNRPFQNVWMSLIEHLGEYKDLGHCECCGDWISNYTLEI